MAVLSQFKRLEGRDGYATVKGLGTRVGEVAQWSMSRREESGELDLRAVFTFVVPNVLLDPDYNDGRELNLRFSKSKLLRIRLDNPERMALTGKVLEMKGVDPEWVTE